jgi:DNA topoisomerase-1
MGIDINNHFLPRYKIPEEKQKVVKELKQLAKKSGEVWLASDEDREGESISWHLTEVLGLDAKTTKRIVFHEITKKAIEEAVQNPRTINMDLVNAQQARRILDRIVGFELSPVLWRKIGMQRSLSAGRVQSVAVRLIAEKEREINQFKSTSSFKIEALLSAGDAGKSITFKAEDGRKHELEAAEKFLQSCTGADYTVTDIQVKPGKKTPAAPFTTSTLQQEASRKLGYGVSKTMVLAQKLYESGKITYMRTDSVNLSDTALNEIENEINKNFGDKYLQLRTYKTKSVSAQEAHEAIRPTFIQNSTDDDPDTKRLYELIWKRTIASQMSDAVLEKTTVKIKISTNNEELTASGEVLKFDGFLKVYMESSDDDDENENLSNENTNGLGENRLPNLTTGQKVKFEQMTATERFTRPPARYTEASLVKKLEELGIGRPSTYAPTISTIIKRNYVEKRDKEAIKRDVRIVKLRNDKVEKTIIHENTGAEKSKLFPTDLGLVVTDFLKQYFDEVMDYSFTANIEEEFDKIAEGKQQWSKMVGDFYEPFHKDVEHTLENADRAKGERELGADPVTNKPIIARMGRYGPMVQVGSQEDEEKPKFAKLKPNQSIETITLEQAIELFKLPRNLGKFEDEDVLVNIGRFGPYASHNKNFYSLNKEMDPYTVELEEVIPMIEEKRKAKDERTLKVFEKEKIQILRGPYGPYIKQGLRNYKLTKEQQERAADLDIEEVKQIIDYVKANPPKKTGGKKKR